MTERLRFDLAGLTRLCLWGLGLFVLAEIVNAANNIHFLWFIGRIEAGEIDYDTAAWIDQITMAIGIGYLVLFVLTAILSSVWIYRASWNARQIQPVATRITPGWAVGWFAVPIANYFMPYKAMKQCWQSSHHPEGDIDGPVPGLLGWWWTAWVLASLTGNVVMRLHMNAETLDAMRSAYIAELVTAPITLASAVLFSRVIRGIAVAQQQRRPAPPLAAALLPDAPGMIPETVSVGEGAR